MEPFELVDRSAAAALQHAAALRTTLEGAARADPRLEDCHEQLHQLMADIVSLRNAAEVLKRQLSA